MTDAEYAALFRRLLKGEVVDLRVVDAAIERAIEVLSPCAHCGACLIVHVCHRGVDLGGEA